MNVSATIETTFTLAELRHLAALPTIVATNYDEETKALYGGWCVVPSDAGGESWWAGCRSRGCEIAMHVGDGVTYLRHGEIIMRSRAQWSGLFGDQDARAEVVAWLAGLHS